MADEQPPSLVDHQFVVPCSPAQVALLQSPYQQRGPELKVKAKAKFRVQDTPLVSKWHSTLELWDVCTSWASCSLTRDAAEEKMRKAANASDVKAGELVDK